MSKQGFHLGGPATYNGPFNTAFPQNLYDPGDKRAVISSHKYRVHAANTRDLLIGVDCNSNCCDCSGAPVAPDTEIGMFLIENGGWPKEADGETYSVMPFNGLAHTTAIDCIFWQVLAAKEGFEFEIVLGNPEHQPVDMCTGDVIGDPVRNFEGEGDIVIGTIDASKPGCSGDRSGSGLILAEDLPGTLLKFNDYIGIRPTAVPAPEEGEDAACVWEGLGLRISPVTKDLCR